ncbi:MAG: DUF5683 domain-containing protein [Rikenellaceae bacterium]
MKYLKYIIAVLIIGVVLQSVAQPPTLTRVRGGVKAGTEVDSLLFELDSLRKDSVLYAKYREDSLQKDSVLQRKLLRDSLRKHDRFSLTEDTISPPLHLLMSFVPGLGQVYNKQYWKAPTFVGLMGGFAAGGAIFGNQYSKTEAKWQAAVNAGADQADIDALQLEMYDHQSASTIFYALAGVTYLYSIADATYNYRGDMTHIRKATVLAALFPGAGFFYTRTYWRIPIYYGGLAVMGCVIDYNNRYYQRFKTAYNLVADGDDTTIDEFNGRFSSDVLKNARDSYRRNRDFGIIAMAGVYLLSVIDTYVIATLKNWDVSPDLAITPTLFNEQLGYTSSVPSGVGLSLQVKF